MKRKTQVFWSAFAITGILIGALCGFVAVDLSTDRYMPNQFGPMFEISSINSGGADFTFLSVNYHLDAAPVRKITETLAGFRGFFPLITRAASCGAAAATRLAQEKLDKLLADE